MSKEEEAIDSIKGKDRTIRDLMDEGIKQEVWDRYMSEEWVNDVISDQIKGWDDDEQKKAYYEIKELEEEVQSNILRRHTIREKVEKLSRDLENIDSEDLECGINSLQETVADIQKILKDEERYLVSIGHGWKIKKEG